jgi:heme oxygenase
MEGQLTAQDYVRYLNQLAYVYQALERKLPLEAEMPYSPALSRFDSIIEDLAELGIEDFAQTPMLSATAGYVSRLNEIGSVEDVRLVAHHYTRYLGDLSGGQAIGALVRRHYGLTEAQTSFYHFAEIENIVRFKEQYRESLDKLVLTESELTELLAEVRLAFRLNQAMFAELGSVEIAA